MKLIEKIRRIFNSADDKPLTSPEAIKARCPPIAAARKESGERVDGQNDNTRETKAETGSNPSAPGFWLD